MDLYFSQKQQFDDKTSKWWIFFLQTQLLASHCVNWWTGVVWIIVMFLSAVWTLILTAPIHCRGSIAEQMMECYCDESAASPLIISTPRPLIAALHQAPDGSGCVREEGRWNSQVWRRVMRHTWRKWSLITAAVICRLRLSSGDRSLPRACTLVSSWVQEGCVEGAAAAPVHADGPGCRAVSSPEVPWPEGGRAAEEAAAPRAPDPRGERVRPPDSAPYLDPSFQNTAPPSQSAFTTRTPDPLFILDTLFPLDTFIVLFLLNKSLSEAWRHTHCVCRLLLPPHWWRMRAGGA